jgi:plastocyanin
VGKLTSLLPALALCGACAQTPAREVMLVANGMSFALADEPENANPALMLRAGERIRLVLKNDAPGMRHDVAIPAWDVATEPIGFGETAQVTFTVPATSGRVDYYCRPHATMMRGLVDVAPIAEPAADH